jgi:hypothetical protein
MIIFVSAAADNWVVLRDDDGALSQHAKLAAREFVEEVAEGLVVALLLCYVLDGELQLALHPAHEHLVDADVVVLLGQLVLHAHQIEQHTL